MLSIIPHPLGGLFQGFTLLSRDFMQGCLQLFGRDFQLSHGLCLHTIKLVGVIHDRRITPLAHLFDDIINDIKYLIIGYGFPGQRRIQLRPEIFVLCIELFNIHGYFTAARI